MEKESALSVNQQEKERGKKNKPYLFQPGQSGNPKGRPKGDKNLTTMLKEALKEIAINPKTGEKIMLNGNEATWGQLLIAQSMFKGILKGEKTIHQMIYDRVEGKPKTTIDFNDMSDSKEEEFSDIKKILSIVSNGNQGTQSEKEEDNSQADS